MLSELAEARDGAENMRRDRALLQAAADGAPTTLRLYLWSEPTLSLGHSQRMDRAADSSTLARLGVGWVRRPTGGLAVLHQPDELTYAFAAARGAVPGVLAAYARVMAAIRAGLRRFVPVDPAPSVPARSAAGPGRSPGVPDLPCHAVATGHEVTLGGRKLASGAQRWRRGAFLQHGSIPWTVERRLIREITRLDERAPIEAVGIAEWADGAAPSRRSVAAALVEAFRTEFAGPAAWPTSAGEAGTRQELSGDGPERGPDRLRRPEAR